MRAKKRDSEEERESLLERGQKSACDREKDGFGLGVKVRKIQNKHARERDTGNKVTAHKKARA